MAQLGHSRRTLYIALASAGVALCAVSAWMAAPHLRALAERTAEVTESVSDAYHGSALAQRLLDDQPDEVLFLFQNSWEIRPTGGFVTALGEGTVVSGQLQNLRVVPSDFYDKSQSIQPPLPEEMRGAISTPWLALRDANWDPDFPTAAATISKIYADASGRQPDLVIAVTTAATEQFLHATGPVTFTVNGHTITLDESNATAELERLTDVEFATLGLTVDTRKEILANFAQALLPKVQQHVSQDPAGAISLALQLLRGYDVQLWTPDAALDRHLSAINARREVAAASNDALLVVDANLAAYKTDPYIERHAAYEVRLQPRPTAKLTLTYTNTSTTAERLTTTYHNYVRVYVPYGSELTNVRGLDDPITTQRHGRTVFGGMLHVPQGQTVTVELSYVLGPSVGTDLTNYALRLERQPGVEPYELTVSVTTGQARRTLTGTTERDVTLR